MAAGSTHSAEGEAVDANAGTTAAAEAGGGKMGGVNEEEELEIERIKRRLEEVFSRQHLADDSFIQQHMNAQLYIPIRVLETHRSFSDLTSDNAAEGTGRASRLILAAALRSEKLGVDEKRCMVKPLMKPRRNILILHDLPEGVSAEDLQKFLAKSPCGSSLSSVKPEVNRTAYACFVSDEAAQDAVLWLRSQKLDGQEIKCSVKSQHFVRSFFPATPPTAPMAYGVVWGSAPMMFQQPATYDTSSMEPWNGNGAATTGWGTETAGDAIVANAGTDKGKRKGKGKSKGKGGSGKSRSRGGSFAASDTDGGQQQEPRSSLSTPVLRASTGPPMGRKDSAMSDAGSVKSSTSGMALPASASDGQPEEDLPCGYTHEYRQYTRQQIVDICNQMDVIDKPQSFKDFEEEEKVTTLFRDIACKEWAPEVTPQFNFTSTFLGDGLRSRALSKDDDFRRSYSHSRKSSSFSRRSRSQSGQSDDWPAGAAGGCGSARGGGGGSARGAAAAAGSAGASGGGAWPDGSGSARARSARRSWSGEEQSDHRYGEWSGSSAGGTRGRHWVEKKQSGSWDQQEAQEQGEGRTRSADKRSSSTTTKRWQPKAKDGAEDKTGDEATGAPRGGKGSTEAAGTEAAAEATEDPQPKSWADRVRSTPSKS